MIKIQNISGQTFELFDFEELPRCPGCGEFAPACAKVTAFCKGCNLARDIYHLHRTCKCGFEWTELSFAESVKAKNEAINRPINPPKEPGKGDAWERKI